MASRAGGLRRFSAPVDRYPGVHAQPRQRGLPACHPPSQPASRRETPNGRRGPSRNHSVTQGNPDPAELERQGLDAFRKGRLAEGVQRLQMALEGYRARGDSLRSAEASNNLSVVLLKSGEPRQALGAVKGTAAVFEAAGDWLRHAQAIWD